MEQVLSLNKIKASLSNFALFCVIVTFGLIVLFHLNNDLLAGIVSGFMLTNAILLLSGYLVYSRGLYAGIYGLLIYTIMVSAATGISLEGISRIGMLMNPMAVGYSIHIFKIFNLIYGTMALLLPILVIVEIVQNKTVAKRVST